MSFGSEISFFGIWKHQDALTSSLHSPVRLFSWCVAKVMQKKVQDGQGWGVLGRKELCQLDGFVCSGYYLNFIYLRYLLRHSRSSRLRLKHLPKSMPLRRADKNKGDGRNLPFIEVMCGDWAHSIQCRGATPKFTFPSIHIPSAGDNAGQFALASASFSFVPAGTDGWNI